MSTQRKEFSFKGQKIFVGLDVHLKSWTVKVLSEQSVLKKFTQDPISIYMHMVLLSLIYVIFGDYASLLYLY